MNEKYHSKQNEHKILNRAKVLPKSIETLKGNN